MSHLPLPTLPCIALLCAIPTPSIVCRHSLAVAQGLIATGVLDLGSFDVRRLFHKVWLKDTHSANACANARLHLSMYRPPRRSAPSGDAPTETRAEQVQAVVSEARVAAQAVAHKPELLQLLRRAIASIYRQGVGLSTAECGTVELVVPLAGTTERARQAAAAGAERGGRGRGRGTGAVANPPSISRGGGRGRTTRFPSSGEQPGGSKRGRH